MNDAALLPEKSHGLHLIDSAVLDIQFERQICADEFQEQAHAFTFQRLLPKINALFEQYSQAGYVISINKLVLNLGEIEETDYLIKIEQQVIELLSRQLRAINFSSNTRHKGCIDSIDNEFIEISYSKQESLDSQWQQLRYYLEKGR